MIQVSENQEFKQMVSLRKKKRDTKGIWLCVAFFAQNPISMPISWSELEV